MMSGSRGWHGGLRKGSSEPTSHISMSLPSSFLSSSPSIYPSFLFSSSLYLSFSNTQPTEMVKMYELRWIITTMEGSCIILHCEILLTQSFLNTNEPQANPSYETLNAHSSSLSSNEHERIPTNPSNEPLTFVAHVMNRRPLPRQALCQSPRHAKHPAWFLLAFVVPAVGAVVPKLVF